MLNSVTDGDIKWEKVTAVVDSGAVENVLPEGFVPGDVTIKAGTTVFWENKRKVNSLTKAHVVGNFQCPQVRGQMMEFGESTEHTFTEAGECVIIETVLKTHTQRITIE